MNKQELISAVSSKTKYSKKEVGTVIESCFTMMQGALKKGEKVQMVNFGSWRRYKRKARLGRNPKTGERLQIPARNIVKFSTGQELMETVN
ncbi:HU family DNA-binding protein [Candidatus Margulisiibacteriota bacterium]